MSRLQHNDLSKIETLAKFLYDADRSPVVMTWDEAINITKDRFRNMAQALVTSESANAMRESTAIVEREWGPRCPPTRDWTIKTIASLLSASHSAAGETLGAYVGVTSAANSKYPDAAEVSGGSFSFLPINQHIDFAAISGQSADGAAMREAAVPETLAEYGDRIAAQVRRNMMDRLPDDVIGRVAQSHIVFGKACAMEAVSTAMRESLALPRATPEIAGEVMRETAAKVADERARAYKAIPSPNLLNAARLGEAERIAAFIRALPLPATPAQARAVPDEVVRLREALEPFAAEADAQERVTSFRDGDCIIPRSKITIGQLRRARAALSAGDGSAVRGEGE